jgi:hypothetical protein
MPENEALGFRVLTPNNMPANVDAIVFPGKNGGLLKIPDYADVVITGFNPDGTPIYKVTYRWFLTSWPKWYPARWPNPFKKPIPGAPPPKEPGGDTKMNGD